MNKLQLHRDVSKLSVAICLVVLVGCQSLPAPEQKQTTTKAATNKPIQATDGVVIHPYDVPEIKRQSIIIPEQKAPSQKFDDGRNLPAFQKLMQQTQTAYAKGELNQAESLANQAQRLAPQSAESFLYLALIANRKNQFANAQALAQRGLSYAQTNAMKKQLWQVILKSGQKQNNTATVNKALQALKGL